MSAGGLDPWVVLLRHVAGDPTVALRSTHQGSGYDHAAHVVQIETTAMEWPRDQFAALIGHEGAHVRLSHYFDQTKKAERYPFFFNFLEDARVHTWLRWHFPGLWTGVDGLEHRALGGFASEATDAVRFLVALRARAMGIPWLVADMDIERDVAKCLPAAQEALCSLPGRIACRDDQTRATSRQFVHLIERHILPVYRRRLGMNREPPQVARPPRLTETGLGSTPSEQWDAIAREVTASIHPLTRTLRDLPATRRTTRWAGGQPRGPRLDRHMLITAAIDSRRWLRAFERPEFEPDGRWRIGLVVDMSGSMRGRPLHHVTRAMVALLEAADRVAVPVSLVAFGGARAEAEVLKRPDQPLAAARARIEEQLLRRPELGDETPLLAALEAVDTLHPSDPELTDLIMVVTDGEPSRSMRGGLRTSVIADPRYPAQCAARIREMESEDRILVGIGVGRTPITGLFSHAVHLDDVRRLPSLIGAVVRDTIRRAAPT